MYRSLSSYTFVMASMVGRGGIGERIDSFIYFVGESLELGWYVSGTRGRPATCNGFRCDTRWRSRGDSRSNFRNIVYLFSSWWLSCGYSNGQASSGAPKEGRRGSYRDASGAAPIAPANTAGPFRPRRQSGVVRCLGGCGRR